MKNSPLLLLLTQTCSKTAKKTEFWNIFPTLMIGNWCRVSDNTDEPKNILKSEIIPYHWNSKKKIQQDYRYIGELYERIFPFWAEYLKVRHGKQYNVKFWEMYTGSWLELIISIIFDRWSTIKSLEDGKGRVFYVLSPLEIERLESLRTTSFDDSLSLYVSEKWNYLVFCELLNKSQKFNLNLLPTRLYDFKKISQNTSSSHVQKLKLKLWFLASKLILKIYYKFTHNVNYCLLFDHRSSVRLRLLDNLLLPRVVLKYNENIPRKHEPIGVSFHNYMKEHGKTFTYENREFENTLFELIDKVLPSFIAEGFSEIAKIERKIPFPSALKNYNTSVGFYNSSLINYKIAKAKMLNSDLSVNVFQHASGYNLNDVMGYERIERRVADKFYSWGKYKSEESDVHLPHLRINQLLQKKKDKFFSSKVLVCTMDWHRYSYIINSNPIGGSVYDFALSQAKFCAALESNLGTKIWIKPYPVDVGYPVSDFRHFFSNNGAIFKTGELQDFTSNACLVVCTYLSTIFLQCIANDIPVIAVLDDKYFSERLTHHQLISAMFESKILFRDFESAECFIYDQISNLETWWNDSSRTQIRNEFKIKFAHPHPSLFKALFKKLNSVN